MFKVISTEIKKILSKPGIYILAVLLAVILVLGVFAYSPNIYENTNISFNGSTFTEKYNDFIGSTNAGEKAEADKKIENATNAVNSYFVTIGGSKLTIQENFNNLKKDFLNTYDSYKECAYNSGITSSEIAYKKDKLLTSLKNLNSAFDNALSLYSINAYPIVTTENNRNEYLKLYKNTYDHFNQTISKDKLADHCAEFSNNLKPEFLETLNKLRFPTLDETLVKNHTETSNSKLYILNERLNNTLKDINDYLVSAQNPEQNVSLAPEMDRLANLYINTANTYSNLVKYTLLSNALKTMPANEQLSALNLKNYSEYDCNSLLYRYSYLFDNSQTENDYARPLAIGITSNYEINTYDYSYFVLKLFSFIIIVYAVIMACHTIAGEIKDGSMRYLAIRPISRTEMYFGKFLAIILISSILIIFSAIISLLVGLAVYGGSSLSILTIFNGTTPIVMHPLAMLTLYLISMLFEVVVYSSIAMLLSCLIKSDLASLAIVVMLYLVNTMLPVFVSGANTWLSFYPLSYINFYSLFGSSVYALNNNFFNILLGSKVYLGTNVAIVLTVIVALVVLINLLAIKLFKRKEL